MELYLFLKGAVLGFAIAAPVGPIGILCIRRTIQYGRLSGLFSGIGAACADTLYGLFAALSLTFVSDFLTTQRIWLHIIGGFFLLFLGTKTFFSGSAKPKGGKITHFSLISDFVSTFLLTLSNPLTVISFIAIFASLGLTHVSEKPVNTAILITGIFTGACGWWILLSEGVTLFRKHVEEKTMSWINRIAGLIIVTFGFAALFTIFH